MSSSEIKRKLAAIMFTDIAGFTALSAKDETKALKLLDTQKDILIPIINKFNGTVHKEMGDGLLLSFPTVTEAVRCGIEIQSETKNIDNLNLRVGIHEGEVTLKDGDVLGDDVNIAARIEPFSAIGGIAISGKVQQNISSLTEFETEYIGMPKLKGVSKEVKVYCITSNGLSKTDKSKISSKLDKKVKLPMFSLIGCACILIVISFFIFQNQEDEEVPSIAILPLENKGESKDEFYSYSISSDLISDVSSAGNIRVASLKDIEKLDYLSLTNQELAKKLYVRYISQGTLWKVDSIFQLSLELYDTKKEKIQWSDNWQQNWSELPSIKGGLSENILTNLEIKTSQNITKIESENAQAYEFYLKAKNIYDKRENTDDTKIAQELLNKALALDENFFAAKLMLGDTYREVSDYDNAMMIFNSVLTKAEELDDKLWIGRTYRKIGIIHNVKGDYEKTLDFFEKSLVIATELGDKLAMANTLNNIGLTYNFKAELVTALDFYKKSLAIFTDLGDRQGVAMGLQNIGINLFRRSKYDEALDHIKRSLKINEELGNKSAAMWNLNAMGLIYAGKNEFDKALDFYNRTLILREDLGDKYGTAWTLITIGNLYHKRNDFDTALDFYEKSLIITKNIGDKLGMLTNHESIGRIQMFKGEYDEALDHYNTSIEISKYLDDKNKLFINLHQTGVAYYNKGDYINAIQFFKKSLSLNNQLKIKDFELSTTIMLYLCYDQTGEKYDLENIYNLIKEVENIDFEVNYWLYKLLKENSFLEKSYNLLQQIILTLDKKIAEKFLNYPISKEIIKLYKEEFSSN